MQAGEGAVNSHLVRQSFFQSWRICKAMKERNLETKMSIKMKVTLRTLESITPYEKNPRLNDSAVDAVAASLEQFGFRQPIVVDGDGVIICGHTRYKAAQKLGLEKVLVHVAKDLSPEQARAYRLADNKSAELADWDFEILPIEISELQEAGFDIGELGFSEKELTQLLDSASLQMGMTDPDAVPELPDQAASKPGEIYQLGNHRLMCGDSSSAPDVEKLMAGKLADLVFQDLPYGVSVEPRSKNAIAAGLSSFPDEGSGKSADKKLRAKDRPIQNDQITGDEFDKILTGWFKNTAAILKPGRSFYCFGGYANLENYPEPMKAAGLKFAQAIVWNKMHPVIGRKDFMGAFELIFYGWRTGKAHRFFGPNNATDLWEIKKVPSQKMQHLTEKPVSLSVRAIQFSSKPGEIVADLFGGSGSTLIGCEQTGRRCYTMEIDELYCDVIRQRWAEFVHGENCDWQKLTPVITASTKAN